SACETGTCIVNRFQGRVTCPYGQIGGGAPRCRVPETQDPVAAPLVPPQLIGRQPDKAVYCSCRCDGPPDIGPFCACPSGFECTQLGRDLGTGHRALAGSYCIKTGPALSNPESAIATNTCSPAPPTCGPP